ncbi:MAG: hypothetical protein FJ104_05165, partial [Deltaproteobacteria bacterium]|nr:hypothetical protein [Deltaproteobacteria bacterium]
VASYILGRDDPDRPHPLVVAGPNGRVFDVEATELLRRKEQAHFDRIAKDGGYVFLAVPSTRWFSRQAITLSAPARTVARYDVRATTPLDDATRSDLTREVKQALAYAAIAAALSRDRGGATYLRLGEAMAQTVDTLASLGGYSYAGLDPATLEPMFRGDDGTSATFDALPTRVRHLVTFAALPVRALWGGYPGRDPREAEGIVAIDEVELQQDGAVLGRIVPALRAALPGVQWIVTTSSAAVAASVEPSETLALRRLPQATDVQVFGDGAATVH